MSNLISTSNSNNLIWNNVNSNNTISNNSNSDTITINEETQISNNSNISDIIDLTLTGSNWTLSWTLARYYEQKSEFTWAINPAYLPKLNIIIIILK